MSRSRITWSREHHQKARAEGLTLVAVGVDDAATRYELMGAVDDDTAHLLLRFAQRVMAGTDPKVAFQSVYEPPKTRRKKR